ncbi:MAG: hypothetical protein QXU18_15985 [Thermoplasmatales archaeon]
MNVVQSPGAENIPASYVSTLASELDSKVKSFPERRIDMAVRFI